MIREALHQFVKANQREFPAREKTIGSSEIGSCARKLWFLKHGAPSDPAYVDRWGAKQRGNLIEVMWSKAMRAYVGKGMLRFAGPYQRTFYDANSPLSATPDGLVIGPDSFLVECKSIDPRARMESIKLEHEAQVQTALGILNENTPYKPTHAIVSYIDASFLDEIKEFRVDYDADVFHNLQSRAKAIFEANQADGIRPEGYIAGGGECEYCAFRSRCSAMRAGAVPGREDKVNGEQLTMLKRLARERAGHVAALDEIERNKKLCEAAIKDILREAETRRVDDPELRITWSAVKGRPAWDWPGLRKAAQTAGLDLAPYEKVGDPSDRLEVKVR